MDPESLGRLENWFAGYVDGFAKEGALPFPLELKRRHSHGVAGNAERIAGALGLGGAEVRLARAAGLLHDVGRFTQFERHRSFRDADTLDHGLEGRRVLEEDGSGPPLDPAWGERLLVAVALHNRRREEIPADLPPSLREPLCIVRDADKLDILRVVLEATEADGFSELPTMIPGILMARETSPEVLRRVARRESVSYGRIATFGDFLLMAASWFHDLNHGPARRLARERGYPARLRKELPAGDAIDALFAATAAALVN